MVGLGGVGWVGRWVGWLVGVGGHRRLVGRLVGGLVGSWVGRLVPWLVGWLVGRWVGRLAGVHHTVLYDRMLCCISSKWQQH